MGKTALVCAVIAALPEFAWTAVKITGHDYEAAGSGELGGVVFEETGAGKETDTARYLGAGARRALLVTRRGQEVPSEEIRRALGADRNVIFESNRIVDAIEPDVCLALMGEGVERKASFEGLLGAADAVVSVGDGIEDAAAGVRWFRLRRADELTSEMVSWLREKLRDHRA